MRQEEADDDASGTQAHHSTSVGSAHDTCSDSRLIGGRRRQRKGRLHRSIGRSEASAIQGLQVVAAAAKTKVFERAAQKYVIVAEVLLRLTRAEFGEEFAPSLGSSCVKWATWTYKHQGLALPGPGQTS